MSDNLKQDTKNIFMLAGIGLIVKMFFGQSTSSDGATGPASAAAWGYGIVLVSAVVLLFVNFGFRDTNSDFSQLSTGEIFSNLFAGATKPIIFVIILLSWLFSMNISHFKNINEGKVANEYNQFSAASTFMLVLDLGLLLKYMLKELESSSSSSSEKNIMALEKLKSGMSLLFVLNLVVLTVMQIILTYFSTDG